MKYLTFIEGADYESEMYRATFRCTRHWFESDGHLEMVEMREILPNGKDLGPPFERTARAMQPGMQVAEVRGGALNHLHCDHRGPGVSHAETKTWGLICTACGALLPAGRAAGAGVGRYASPAEKEENAQAVPNGEHDAPPSQ